MRHIIDTFVEPALWFAADWSLRWAALLAVVALMLWIFRPRRAAIRQLLLLVALIAGLLVPFSPRWGDGWQPADEQKEQSISLPFPRSAWERTPGRSASRPAQEPAATQSVAHLRSHADRGNENETPSEPFDRHRIIVLSLVSCWIIAVVYQLIRHLCGWIFLRRLRRESVEATGATADLFAACRTQMQIASAVQLATHPRIRSPILFGWLRPRILVPPDWPQRSIESQRAGLLHELAHVRRRDHLFVPLLEIIRIAFFFHPLVRRLLARLEQERELLCDEMVVRLGIDRRDYARLLLEFARSSGRLAWPVVSLPMSRRRTVKGRIHHLLEEDMERWIGPLPARWAIVLGGGLLALSLGLASLRVRAVERNEAEALAEDAAQQAAANKPAEPSVKREDLRYGGKDFNGWRRELLTELKPSIRADGMKALGTFGANGYGTEATQAILEMMRSYDPAIENSLHEDAPVVKAAFSAIEKIGSAAVPSLAAAINEENRNIRRFASIALGRLRLEAQAALPALLKSLKNEDRDTRAMAIEAVGWIGRGGKDIVAALLEASGDDDVRCKLSAIYAFTWIGKSAKPAVPALLKDLSNPNAEIRAAAISALRSVAAGEEAVPAISRLLQDESNDVRSHAYRYLETMKGEEIKEAVPGLIPLLGDVHYRSGAVELLARIGPPAKRAVPALQKLLRCEDTNVRKKALQALEKISPDDKR